MHSYDFDLGGLIQTVKKNSIVGISVFTSGRITEYYQDQPMVSIVVFLFFSFPGPLSGSPMLCGSCIDGDIHSFGSSGAMVERILRAWTRMIDHGICGESHVLCHDHSQELSR